MQPFYGILILFLCTQLQTGICDVSSKSHKPHDPQSNDDPDEQLKGTIKWPFSDVDFKRPIQSPIDVLTYIATERKDLKKLSIHEPVLPGAKADVLNSGKTAVIYIKDKEHEKLPYLEGGPLRDKFVFEQMHFHWGRNDEWGSEHMLNSQAFSVEVHMVHFNSKHGTFQKSLSKTDGLAVLTIFAEVHPHDNKLLEPLYQLLPDLKEPNDHKVLPWNDAMKWAISGMETNTEYYTYPGSLTTPDYNQNVAFIILPKPITISHKQLNAFRGLYHEKHKDPIIDNKRNIQPLNDRPIYKGHIHVEVDNSAKA